MEDPQAGPLALLSQFERRMRSRVKHASPSGALPQEEVNILLVASRPYEQDVDYRSIARPLMNLIEDKRSPVNITVLRPPTVESLEEHLHDRPDYYHILHFDGHGSYRLREGKGHTARTHGCLVFEDGKGNPVTVPAAELSILIREHKIPIVVLNACRSGMVDEDAEDAFVSVACALLKAGIRSVVAMSYSLYVTAAQEFLPAFYQRLFESGSTTEAVRFGRKRLMSHSKRLCIRGRYDLEDWLVPVLYRAADCHLKFATSEESKGKTNRPTHSVLSDFDNPYGCIGRDAVVLELERALRRQPAGVLLYGLAGVGKTTLTRGFIHWLIATDGIDAQDVFWFSFGDDIRSADFIINSIGQQSFGPDFISRFDQLERFEAVIKHLQERKCIVVWDDFECVRGISGTSISPTLDSNDQTTLKLILKRLRDSSSKVLINSRREECWLGTANAYSIGLEGLKGEELWHYIEVIVDDLTITANRADRDFGRLVDLLNGHPLAVRVVLPELERKTLRELITVIESGTLNAFAGDEDANAALEAALRCVVEQIPAKMRELLLPLSLHHRHLDKNYLNEMIDQSGRPELRGVAKSFLQILSRAGVISRRNSGLYTLHPIFPQFARKFCQDHFSEGTVEEWSEAYVAVLAHTASSSRAISESRMCNEYSFFREEWHRALNVAIQNGWEQHIIVLTLAISNYSRAKRDISTAEALTRDLDVSRDTLADGTLQFLLKIHNATLAYDRGSFDEAEKMLMNAKEQIELQNDSSALFEVYVELAMCATAKRDFDAADVWHDKAEVHANELDDQKNLSFLLMARGIAAQHRGNYEVAEDYFRTRLEYCRSVGEPDLAARVLHQLGRVNLLRGDLAQASRYLEESSGILVKLGALHEAGVSLMVLGNVRFEAKEFDRAEDCYLRALSFHERLNDKVYCATVYRELGRVNEEKENWTAAQNWYRKAVSVFDSCPRENEPLHTLVDLAITLRKAAEFTESESILATAMQHAEAESEGHAMCLYHLGLAALEQGNLQLANETLSASLVVAEKLGPEGKPLLILRALGECASQSGRIHEYEQLMQRAMPLAIETGDLSEVLPLTGTLSRLQAEKADWHSEVVTVSGTPHSLILSP